MGESGHWTTDETGQRSWQGPRNRTEKRGPAIIGHRFDVPVMIMECLLPGGSRGWVLRMLPTKEHPSGEWYRHLADGSVQVGHIEMSAEDVRFMDDTQRGPRHLRPMRRDGRRATPSKLEGRMQWDGPPRSLERHGPALIEFITGRADVVTNCLLPNGSRGTAHCDYPLINPFGGWWRRAASDGRWQVGEIVVSDHDVRFIDHDLPQTSDERGGWSDDPRLGKVWDGPNCWAEPHGQAVVVTLGDTGPFTVFACLPPDGSRATATRGSEKLEHGQHQWRRPLADGSWQTGEIEITESEVRFVDGPPRTSRKLGSRSTDDAPDLCMDLMASTRIAELVRDRPFAEDLYRALCNTRWFRDGKEWGCTWRSAGGIVADLRDLGEEYIDFYCSGQEGTVTTEVADELAALGWTSRPY